LNESVCYDFNTINEWVDMDIPTFCTELTSIVNQCQGQGADCGSKLLYNFLASMNDQEIYGWLFFDTNSLS